MSRFTTVPPAVVPVNAPRSDGQIRADRSRQATFERGVALAIVAGMIEAMRRLVTLRSGLRWLLQDDEALEVRQWMERLQEDILRTERIEERADGE